MQSFEEKMAAATASQIHISNANQKKKLSLWLLGNICGYDAGQCLAIWHFWFSQPMGTMALLTNHWSTASHFPIWEPPPRAFGSVTA